MGHFAYWILGSWVFVSAVKIETWGLEMGVSERTSFTDSSSTGGGGGEGGFLLFTSWVKFDLDEGVPRWG